MPASYWDWLPKELQHLIMQYAFLLSRLEWRYDFYRTAKQNWIHTAEFLISHQTRFPDLTLVSTYHRERRRMWKAEHDHAKDVYLCAHQQFKHIRKKVQTFDFSRRPFM